MLLWLLPIVLGLLHKFGYLTWLRSEWMSKKFWAMQMGIKREWMSKRYWVLQALRQAFYGAKSLYRWMRDRPDPYEAGRHQVPGAGAAGYAQSGTQHQQYPPQQYPEMTADHIHAAPYGRQDHLQEDKKYL